MLLALISWFPLSQSALGHEGHTRDDHSQDESLVGDWIFRAQYALRGGARHITAAPQDSTQSVEAEFSRESPALRLAGWQPTERYRNLLTSKELPRNEFTFETWINNHVNRPVGMAAVAGDASSPQNSGWALAYHTLHDTGSRVVATFGQPKGKEPIEIAFDHGSMDGFKEYWWHAVLTFDGKEAKLYLNGELRASTEIPAPGIAWSDNPVLEIASYLKQEPEMVLANLLSQARLYRRVLSANEIHTNYERFCHEIEHGIVYPKVFHFTAGPYLNYATTNSIRVLWETDIPATARVEWGLTSKLDNSATLDVPKRIQEFEIPNLKAHTPYFYRVTAINESGEQLSSGTLTFQTAVNEDEPYRLVVLGDTETRPHINHALSNRVWGERPNFVVVLGDLTDGGMQDFKWQWSHEYFTGIAGLCSRVPFYPVPGNGEGDLYWYKRYHSLPGDESPYSFRYGNSEFFMLDSNRRDAEFPKGTRQYNWLEQRLQASTATWKFVCFHHAPFSSDDDDYGNSWDGKSVKGDPHVRHLVPLFEKYKVDIVMFGHIHSYERSRKIKSMQSSDDGVLYLLCGGGGGNLEDFAPNPVSFSSKVYRGHHYCLLNIEKGLLDLRMYDLTGAMLDRIELTNEE